MLLTIAMNGLCVVRTSMQKLHHSRFLKKPLALLMAETRKSVHGLFLHLKRKSRMEAAHIIRSKETMQTILVKENQKISDIVF